MNGDELLKATLAQSVAAIAAQKTQGKPQGAPIADSTEQACQSAESFLAVFSAKNAIPKPAEPPKQYGNAEQIMADSVKALAIVQRKERKRKARPTMRRHSTGGAC